MSLGIGVSPLSKILSPPIESKLKTEMLKTHEGLSMSEALSRASEQLGTFSIQCEISTWKE